MKYSREHEAEADIFALSAMLAACLPPKTFADILQRLQSQAMDSENDSETSKSRTEDEPKPLRPDPVSELLASHPDTQARVKPFLDAKQDCN